MSERNTSFPLCLEQLDEEVSIGLSKSFFAFELSDLYH
jgi:hypothetical protein